jgi:hypothetical protein
MNIEVHILVVVSLLVVMLAYGKELLVSLVTLCRKSGQNQKSTYISDRKDDAENGGHPPSGPRCLQIPSPGSEGCFLRKSSHHV